jgi:hypothetical protein
VRMHACRPCPTWRPHLSALDAAGRHDGGLVPNFCKACIGIACCLPVSSPPLSVCSFFSVSDGSEWSDEGGALLNSDEENDIDEDELSFDDPLDRGDREDI